MNDYFGIPINIGDTVSFTTSGIFEDGVVLKFAERYVVITNSSGNKKIKVSNCVINKTIIINSLKRTIPEEFI